MLKEVRAVFRDGSLNMDLPTLGRDILDQSGAVVLKGFLTPEAAAAAHDAVYQWGLDVPPMEHGTPMHLITPELNYHRIDADPTKSSAPHIHHNFTFGRFDRLDEPYRTPIVSAFEAMRLLQNGLTGNAAQFSPTDDKYKLRPQVLHYPAGGGFFVAHEHNIEPQRIGLVMALSRRGVDHETGSFRVKIDGEWQDTTGQHEAGDVILFRYDLTHEVTPCDPHLPLHIRDKAGRWTMVLPYY